MKDVPVRHFFDWFSQHVIPEDPWLILGTGPSFAFRKSYDLSGYHLFCLNHVVREQAVLVAHVIDLDVVQACADVLEHHARFLVMPWYPHVENRPGSLSLEELQRNVPLLRRLAEAGRLLWYDLSSSPVRRSAWPVVQATYFSAEAALSLLALAGARRVRTLGVDGGTDYSSDFDDLRQKTLLANGRASFDLQFEGFARTILGTGVDVAPLNVPSPVRIYVAHTPAETLPVAVLRHSIRRRSSLSVEFLTLPTDAPPLPDEMGPAIVLSPRAHCVADVRPLWMGQAGEGEVVLPACPPRRGDVGIGLVLLGPGIGSEVAHLATLLRAGVSAAPLLAVLRAPTRTGLPPVWNPDARYHPDRSRFVHYPQDGSEPWLSRVHPLGYLWVRELLDGVARGFITAELVAAEIRRGYVRPSLAYQVEHMVEEPLLVPRVARVLDQGFRPGAQGWRRGLVTSSVAVLQALARQVERSARRRRAPVQQLASPQWAGDDRR
jgi:hypothetical protein